MNTPIPTRQINYVPYYSEIRQKQSYAVISEYQFYDHLVRLQTIPAGFIFDGCSRPSILEPLLPMNSTNNIAFARHDWLYYSQHTTRKQADLQLFIDLLKNPLNSLSKCLLVYINLRLFGWRAWNDNETKKAQYGKDWFILHKAKLNKLIESLNSREIQYN